MPAWSNGYSRDLSPLYRAEEKRLIAKGLIPGSRKLTEVLYRNVARKARNVR